MKKNNNDTKVIKLRISGHRRELELKRSSKKYNPNKSFAIKKVCGLTLIQAPVSISIYECTETGVDNYSSTMRFVKDINTLISKEKCIIDFSKTKKVSAAGMIVIYAAVEKNKENSTYKTYIRWSKVSPAVNNALKQTNFLKLVDGKSIKYSLDSVRKLPIVTGVSNNRIEDVLDYIQFKIYDDMSPETEYIYGDAVTETINNVGLHAYPKEQETGKQWWLMCDVQGDQLYLAIYDMGVGIPKTVIDKPWFYASAKHSYPSEYKLITDAIPNFEERGLRAYIPTKFTDAQLVYLSMQGDVTGTQKSKHGQGSKSIKALVNETENGKLWVFSNKGLYVSEQDSDAPTLSRLPKKFPGTLIQWNIKIA